MSGRSSGSRFSFRSPNPTTALITRGSNTTASTGISRNTQAYGATEPGRAVSSVTAEISRPLASCTGSVRKKAAALRDLGTPSSRPISIWAITGQSEPGMYLPS